jgi:hypothetical protein
MRIGSLAFAGAAGLFFVGLATAAMARAKPIDDGPSREETAARLMNRLDGAWTMTGGGAGERGLVISGGSLDRDMRDDEVKREHFDMSIVSATDDTGEVELRGVRTEGAFGSEVVEHYRVEIRRQDGRDSLSLTEMGESPAAGVPVDTSRALRPVTRLVRVR